MRLLITCSFVLTAFLVHAQNHRSAPDPDLAPFYHGVASGDPLTDAVIIWTRLTPDNEELPLIVNWRMATDTAMTDIVASGEFATFAERDYTVKVDVTGLNSGSCYYYDFEWQGSYSIRGRTRTLPEGEVDQLRVAVMSCSNYEHGYFNAYKHIAIRNDLDVVLHLGDYIYEYEVGGYSAFIDGRQNEPVNEILTLEDYRIRHSHYKLDEDLMRAHQQHPWITVWDDHEFANDAWFGGAQNHQDWEGDWFDRKQVAWQSYFEWMPAREQEDYVVRKSFEFGDLAKIYFLDTRIEGRDEQVDIGSDAVDSQDRTLLGEAQKEWLDQELEESESTWDIFAQQVMMAPLEAFGAALNTDQWDGYTADRQWVFDKLEEHSVENFVVFTGDIHTSWCNNIPTSGYSESSQTGSMGVEFVATSVTSAALPLDIGQVLVQLLNPHVEYVNLTEHGYMLVDITPQRVQTDWIYMNTVLLDTYGQSVGASWKVNSGSKFAQNAGNQLPVLPGDCPLAPLDVTIETGVKDVDPLVLLGVYPNPSTGESILQFSLEESAEIHLSMWGVNGQRLRQQNLGALPAGLNYTQISFDLPAGVYVLEIRDAAGTSCSTKRLLVH